MVQRCSVAPELHAFLKTDMDRAPVIQSYVYTEIHTILTPTSVDVDSCMLRGSIYIFFSGVIIVNVVSMKHDWSVSFVVVCVFTLFASCLFESLAFLFLFVFELVSSSICQLSELQHACCLASSCAAWIFGGWKTFFFLIYFEHLYHEAFKETFPFLIIKANK